MDDFDFDAVFGTGIPPVEEIHVDEEEEAKRYMLSLYERLNQLRDKKDAEQEVLRSNAEAGTSVSLVFSDDSAQEEEPPLSAFSEFLEMRDGHIKVLPAVKTSGAAKWENILSHHEKRMNELANKILKIKPQSDIVRQLREVTMSNEYARSVKLKDKSQRSLAVRTLTICEMERIIKTEIGELAFALKDIHAVIDPITQGLWIEDTDSKEQHDLLSSLGTRRIVLSRRFRMNSRQTDDLITVLLSSNARDRACAKLNLASNLDQSIYAELIARPGQVLELSVLLY